MSSKDIDPGTDGRTKPDIECFNCHKYGHFANNCPGKGKDTHEAEQHMNQNESNQQENDEETKYDNGDDGVEQYYNESYTSDNSDDESVIMSFQFFNRNFKTASNIMSKSSIDDRSILIDTGSTFSVIRNPKMLINVRNSSKTLRAVTNGGNQDHTMKGDLPGFFTVWYNPMSKLNILAWADVRKRFRITSDTSISNSINVHVDEETVIVFDELDSGLYVWTPNINNNSTNKQISSYSFLTLVRTNKENFTPEEVRRADRAKLLYEHCGAPGYAKYLKWLANNYFINCPITVDDAKRALHIYGKDLLKLKASSVRIKPNKLGIVAPIEIPREVWEHHQEEIIGIDHLYVQTLPFCHSIGISYKFWTIDSAKGTKKPRKDDIIRTIKRIINLYHARNITVKQINADNEFACVEEEITPVKMNIVAAGQHVGDVERSIRTIKEGTRYHVHRLPYRRYPACMIRGCLIKVVKERNNLPAENGVSRTVSPCTMIMGRPPPDYNEVIKLNFGDYVQTHNVRSRTNDNEQRTVGAIALYPTENGQGSWVFMSLVTGKEIHRYQWKYYQ